MHLSSKNYREKLLVGHGKIRNRNSNMLLPHIGLHHTSTMAVVTWQQRGCNDIDENNVHR